MNYQLAELPPTIGYSTCPLCDARLTLVASVSNASNPLPKPLNFCVCHECSGAYVIEPDGKGRPFTDKEKEVFGQSPDIRKVWDEQRDIKEGKSPLNALVAE